MPQSSPFATLVCRLINILLVTALAFSWATAFPLVAMALDGWPPLSIVTIRIVIAMLILVGCCRWQLGYWPKPSKAGSIMAITGMVLPFLLITWGQQYLSAATAAMLIAMVPLFTLILTCLGGTSPLTMPRILGVLLALAGVTVLVLPNLTDSTNGTYGWLAPAAVLLAALGYAFINLYGKHLLQSTNRWQVSGELLLMSSIFLVGLSVVSVALGQPFVVAYDGFSWPEFSIVLLGVLPTALATIIYFIALDRVGALATAITSNLVPVFAMLLAVLLGQEELQAMMLVSLGLILAGVVLVQRPIKSH